MRKRRDHPQPQVPALTGQKTTEEAIYEKVLLRIKNNKWIAALLLAFMLFGGIAKFFQNIKDVKEVLAEPGHSSDLVVAPLKKGLNLTKLEGYPDPKDLQGGTPSFAEGVQVTLTLANDKKGKQTIVVHEITINTESFEQLCSSRPDYRIDESQIHGKGMDIVDEFGIVLSEGDVAQAFWRDKSGKAVPIHGRNLLETAKPRVINLSDSDDVLTLKGIIVAGSPGDYRVSFSLKYWVAGKPGAQTTGSFVLHAQD